MSFFTFISGFIVLFMGMRVILAEISITQFYVYGTKLCMHHLEMCMQCIITCMS